MPPDHTNKKTVGRLSKYPVIHLFSLEKKDLFVRCNLFFSKSNENFDCPICESQKCVYRLLPLGAVAARCGALAREAALRARAADPRVGRGAERARAASLARAVQLEAARRACLRRGLGRGRGRGRARARARRRRSRRRRRYRCRGARARARHRNARGLAASALRPRALWALQAVAVRAPILVGA